MDGQGHFPHDACQGTGLRWDLSRECGGNHDFPQHYDEWICSRCGISRRQPAGRIPDVTTDKVMEILFGIEYEIVITCTDGWYQIDGTLKIHGLGRTLELAACSALLATCNT